MSRPPQRILHVPRRFSQSEWGGTEAVVANLCRAQIDQGYRPEIHTSRALAATARENWRDIPIRRYRYCYPFLGLTAQEKHSLDKKGGNLLSLSLFGGLVAARNVRIYHAHVTKRMGGSVLTAARLRSKPCVVTLHGNVFDVPESEASEVAAAQDGHFEWGRPFGALFRSRQLLQLADAVICVGYSEYERARQQLGPERVHFQPNGVHTDHFELPKEARIEARKRLNIPPDAKLIGCISRLDPQKNQALLLDAFEQLANENSSLYLLLCGPETVEGYAGKIRTRCAESPYADRIRLLPPVAPDSHAHASLFAALDIFVLPSRHEPFGIVVLEAWAARKPVIAAKVGGLQRLIENGRTGVHFGSGSLEELTAAIKALASEAPMRRRLAEAGRAEIEAHYTWHKISDQLEQIYQQVEGD